MPQSTLCYNGEHISQSYLLVVYDNHKAKPENSLEFLNNILQGCPSLFREKNPIAYKLGYFIYGFAAVTTNKVYKNEFF